MTNAVLALPTLVGGAWLNAKDTADLLAEVMEPRGSQPTISGAGEGVRVGHVREDADGFEWLSFEQFSKTHRMRDDG